MDLQKKEEIVANELKLKIEKSAQTKALLDRFKSENLQTPFEKQVVQEYLENGKGIEESDPKKEEKRAIIEKYKVSINKNYIYQIHKAKTFDFI